MNNGVGFKFDFTALYNDINKISADRDTIDGNFQRLESAFSNLRSHWSDNESTKYITEWDGYIQNAHQVAKANLAGLGNCVSNIKELVDIYKS